LAKRASFLLDCANGVAARAKPGSVAKPYTISAVVPILIASAASAEGVDPTQIVSAQELAAPPRADEHIAVDSYFAVWDRALALIPDPAFALRAATVFQLEDHEVFGFLAMSCQTLGQAYERTAQYRALYCVGARWELQLEADAARLIWYPWPGDLRDPGYRAAMDFAVADMADAIRRLGRSAPMPRAVQLRHAAPLERDKYAAHYGVAPSFGSPLYELVYARELPDLPISGFNSRLREYFDQECQRLLSQASASTSMAALVRKQLIGLMDGGDTSIEAMAKRLALSSRSLQRRLTEEGTRYNDVLAQVRSEFAQRYLARGSISASEVAYLIGFTEPPAFFKAFKRWTGKTPREFQQSAASGG
jgi:AraC-like DNA-binding protein